MMADADGVIRLTRRSPEDTEAYMMAQYAELLGERRVLRTEFARVLAMLERVSAERDALRVLLMDLAAAATPPADPAAPWTPQVQLSPAWRARVQCALGS